MYAGRYIIKNTSTGRLRFSEEMMLFGDGTFQLKTFAFHSFSISKGSWTISDTSLVLNSDFSDANKQIKMDVGKQVKLFWLFRTRRYEFKVSSADADNFWYSIYLHNQHDTVVKRNCIGATKNKVPKKFDFFYIVYSLGAKYPDFDLPKSGTRIRIQIPLTRMFVNEIWNIKNDTIRPLDEEGNMASYVLVKSG